jgi:hypothetical protein
MLVLAKGDAQALDRVSSSVDIMPTVASILTLGNYAIAALPASLVFESRTLLYGNIAAAEPADVGIQLRQETRFFVEESG